MFLDSQARGTHDAAATDHHKSRCCYIDGAVHGCCADEQHCRPPLVIVLVNIHSFHAIQDIVVVIRYDVMSVVFIICSVIS